MRATRAELDHLAPGTAARRDLRDATLAIATHPATDRATLAEATTASLTDVDPAAADFRAATVLRARTAPTTTPLPDLTDPVAGWAHVWPLQAAEVNAIRAQAAALTGGLDTLARAGGAPVAARLLDAEFTGTFDDLVTTTLTVTA